MKNFKYLFLNLIVITCAISSQAILSLDYGHDIPAGHLGLVMRFFRAIRDNDLNRLEDSIQQAAALPGGLPSVVSIAGETPLHRAASHLGRFGIGPSNPEVIQRLVDAGANINSRSLANDGGANPNNLGRSPLYVAISDGQVASVQKLIALGANVNLLNADGKTALDLATDLDIENNPEIIELLTNVGALHAADLPA